MDKVHKSLSVPKQLCFEPIQAGVGHHQEDQDNMARPIPKHLLTRCTPGRSWADTTIINHKETVGFSVGLLPSQSSTPRSSPLAALPKAIAIERTGEEMMAALALNPALRSVDMAIMAMFHR